MTDNEKKLIVWTPAIYAGPSIGVINLTHEQVSRILANQPPKETTTMPTTSYKAEVTVGSDPKWYDNALRFATHEEASAYAKDLFSRWTSTREWRVTETTDPVTAKWSPPEGEAARSYRAELITPDSSNV